MLLMVKRKVWRSMSSMQYDMCLYGRCMLWRYRRVVGKYDYNLT